VDKLKISKQKINNRQTFILDGDREAWEAFRDAINLKLKLEDDFSCTLKCVESVITKYLPDAPDENLEFGLFENFIDVDLNINLSHNELSD